VIKLQDWTRSIAEAFLVPDENRSSTEDIDSDSDGSSTYGARSSSTVSTTPTRTPTQSPSRRFSKDTTSQQSSSFNNYDQYYILPDIDPNATMAPLFSGWTAYRGTFVSPPLVPVTHWDDLVRKRKEERIKEADLEEESREEIVLHDSPTQSTEQQTVSTNSSSEFLLDNVTS
jgi:hypothetical protein